MDFIHLENARVDDQKEVMRQIAKDNVCPFCTENLAEYHKKEIYAEGEHWILTENQWPYEQTKKHLLAIAKQHVESLSDLPAEAGAELFELFQKGMKQFGISGGALAMRFGEVARPASTVRHLHAHLIEPDSAPAEHKGVSFKISKSAEQQ